MSRLRIHSFSISLDGYGAGADQSLENPLGKGGESLHGWFVPTRTFQRMQGNADGTTGRQYLQARLIDHREIAISPVLLGKGEPLLQGIDLLGLGYELKRHASSENAMHLVITRKGMSG